MEFCSYSCLPSLNSTEYEIHGISKTLSISNVRNDAFGTYILNISSIPGWNQTVHLSRGKH